MKQRLLSLLLTMVMVFGMLPTTTFAADETDAITVTVLAQQDGAFLLMPETLSVYADLSEEYGITTDETNHQPTVLDALVAAHIAVYGGDFTVATASDYLAGSSVTKSFGVDSSTAYSGYAVNGVGVADEYGWGAYANEAILTADDVVDFFFYSSTYADYYTYFDADAYQVTAGEALEVTLKGYNYMTYGCDPSLSNYIEAIEGVTIATVAASGDLTALEYTTDAEGVATIQFPESGAYTISATGTVTTQIYDYATATMIDADVPIFCPLATVTVTAPAPTISMPDTVWLGTADGAYYAFAPSSDDFTHQFTTSITDPIWTSSSNYVSIDSETGLATAMPSSATSYRSAKITATSAADETISVTTEYVYFFYPFPDALSAVEMTLPEDGLSEESAYVSVGVSGLGDCIVWTLEDGQDIVTTEDDLTENDYRFEAIAKKSGTTAATATFDATNVNAPETEPYSATVEITVTGVAVNDAAGGTEAEIALIDGEVIAPIQLTATVKEGNTVASWTSSDETVATVDQTGIVTIAGSGTTFIYATDSEGAKGGYRIQVSQTGVPYFDNLNFSYLSNWSTTTSFAQPTTEYDLQISAYTTTKLTISSTTDYDAETYTATYSYTDGNGDAQTGTVNDKAITYLENIPFGTTVVTLTLADIADPTVKNEITLHVTRPRDTGKALKATTGIVLVPDGRSLLTTKYDGYAEGTMFKADETGVTLGTTGVATTTYYYRTNLLEGLQNFSLNLTASTSYAWMRYSTDDGATWSEAAQYSDSTDTITFPTGETTQKVLIQVLDDTTYNANGNAFVPESATTYTLWIDSVAAASGDAQIATATFTYGDLYGAKDGAYDPGIYTYSVLIPNACTETTMTYTIPEGAIATIGSTQQTPDGEGNYSVTWTSGTTTIVITSADGTTTNSYAFAILKQSGYDVPDAIVDYLVPNSQYTNGTTYGYKGETMISGSTKSLGNFGGYATFYYENGITNDPNNLYGLDFYVQGNAASGTDSLTEPGQVWVSEDNVTWYALAGSEHYEDDTITDYQVTYTKTDDGKNTWVDNQGNSGTSSYNYPGEANYPLHDFTGETESMTFTGVLLPSALGVDVTTSTANYATLPAFGYTDGSVKVGTTLSTYSVNDTNVYTENPATGEGFDLAWAVDEAGQPVDVDGKAFNYVKVVTASHIYCGSFGEKSTEVTYVIRTTAQETAVGVTDAPSGVTISSAVGTYPVTFQDGKTVYDVNLGDAKYLSISVNGADTEDNIYINNQRIAADGEATGFVVYDGNNKTVRIIVQNGDKEPVIYILNLTSDASSASDGIESIYANVAGSNREATRGNDGNYTLSVAYTVDAIGIAAVTSEAYTVNGSTIADSYALTTGDNVFTLLTAGGQTVTLTVTKGAAPTTSGKTLSVYVTVYAPSGEYDEENPLVFSDSKSGFETILSKTKVTVDDGATAWEAIQTALDDADISYENADGNYISAVNDLGEFTRGPLSGWLYTVEGDYPEYGVNEYILDNYDVIVLHYTEDYTQEENAPVSSGSGTTSSDEEDEETTESDVTTSTQSATVTVETQATTDSNGTAKAEVDGETVTQAIAQVMEAAGETDSTTTKEVILKITADETATSVETTIPKETMTTLHESVDAVKLETPVAGLSLDAAVLETIATEAGSDVLITVSKAELNENASDETKNLIGERDAFSFEITSGSTKISQFGGNITIHLPYTPAVGEHTGKLIVLYIADDGTATEIPGAYYDATTKSMCFTTNHFSTFAIGYDENKAVFDDVTSSHWFYEAVNYVTSAGLFNGTTDTQFSPYTNMTRAMVWTVLARNSGVDTTTGTLWYEAGMNWVMAEGISDGSNPDDNVTREQLATMLYRYANETAVTTDMTAFTDLDTVSAFALEAMNWAVSTGIVTGKTTTTLVPNANATRAEVATMLMRYLNK